MTQTITGVLEVDTDRGVIYFHASRGARAGTTVLRICQLEIPEDFQSIDITHMHGAVITNQESPRGSW